MFKVKQKKINRTITVFCSCGVYHTEIELKDNNANEWNHTEKWSNEIGYGTQPNVISLILNWCDFFLRTHLNVVKRNGSKRFKIGCFSLELF